MLRISIYYILLGLFLLILSSCKKDQSIEEEQSDTFIKFFGGQGTDYATDVILFNDGYALTGTIQTADSSNQAFIIATDKYGNELPWSPVKLGGLNIDVGNKIFQLKSGDFIVVGTHYVTAANADMLVARVGLDGVIKWKKYFGGLSNDEGNFGVETSANELLVGGYTQSFGNGHKDICIYKINLNGDSIGSLALGASLNDIGNDIVEMNNFYYIVGTTNSYNISNRNEIITVKINTDLVKALGVNIFGVDALELSGVKIQKTNSDFLILGQSVESGTNRYGLYSLKINESLNELWSTQYTSNDIVTPKDMVLNNTGYDVAGTRVGVNTNIFIYRFNNDGQVIDSVQVSSNSNQQANAIILSNDSKNCIAGSNGIQNKSQIALYKGLF